MGPLHQRKKLLLSNSYMDSRVILKKGREKSLSRGHPWIFSGAIERMPPCLPGTVLPIFSKEGAFLAQGYFHPKISLAGRILSFRPGPIEAYLEERLSEAIALRKSLFDEKQTNAFRLINAEGDGLPGLIVDVYNGYLVMQIHTQGMEKLKEFLLDRLIRFFLPKGVYEKSLSPSRTEEGLPPNSGLLYGEIPEQIDILENGKHFRVSIPEGQKTGFFLDQREMRAKVESLAKGRTVLNAFSYTGAFGIYALAGGAKSVTSVDRCSKASALALENSRFNNFSPNQHLVVQEDLFSFLDKGPFPYDFVILDPPAFVKKRSALEKALKAYQNLNETILRKLPPQSLLLTCSCSYHVKEEFFYRAVYTAAHRAGRKSRILAGHLQASDHVVSLNHPEGAYLKSLLLFVE